MTTDNSDQIPIGQFSKMTRLSVKALRLYDEQGLLHPAQVDASSGYRYYQLAQAQQAEIIRVLRLVDMPLKQITRILQSDSPAAIGQQLVAHKSQLAEKMASQARMLDYLDSLIQHQELVMHYEVAIVQQLPQPVASVKIHSTLDSIPADIAKGFATLVAGLQASASPPTGAPMILYHNVIDQESAGDVEIAIPIGETFAGADGVLARQLEGGEMASLVHRGPYPEIAPAYHFLTRWISENGYQIVGPTREIYVNDPQMVPEAELLTRLEFPVGAMAES